MVVQIKDKMSTHLITISWDESIKNAYAKMHSRKVRHLPVYNDLGEIIGMLSDRDIQRAMISQVTHPNGQFAPDEKIEFDADSKVRDYMSWPAKTVDLSTDLRVVAERMITEKVSSLLVIDQDKAVGIITAEDLLKVLIDLLNDPKTPIRKTQWSLEEFVRSSAKKFESAFN